MVIVTKLDFRLYMKEPLVTGGSFFHTKAPSKNGIVSYSSVMFEIWE